jgi:hypothetical protein
MAEFYGMDRMKSEFESTAVKAAETDDGWLKAVRSQVNSVRFGVVQIVIHDSRVVQIERTEKIRFDKSEAS